MVETTDHEWAIVDDRRSVATMRQHPSGLFFVGQFTAGAHKIEEAAKEIAQRIRPRDPR
jgi:hypothetical protein